VFRCKALALEHIIRGPYYGWEIYNGENDADGANGCFYGAGYKQSDQGVNADEVQGHVNCGDTYNATMSKTHIKLYKQSDILGAKAQLISYAGRPNFACSYDGQLGQQVTSYLKPDGSTGYTYSYGSLQKLYTLSNLSPISGLITYMGKYGGKDMFATSQTQDRGVSGKRNFDIVPISSKVKYNGFNSLLGLGAILSPSGKSYILTRQGAPYRNIPWNLIPPQSKRFEAFVVNDAGTDIDYVWRTIVPTAGDYGLFLGGPNNSTTTPSAGQAFSNQGGMSPPMIAVNDLLIASSCHLKLVVMKISTGEVLQTIYGDDLDFSENWYQTRTRLSDNKTTQQGGQALQGINYNSGNLIIPLGNERRQIEGPSGRNIAALTLKYPTKQTMNMTSIYVPTGSVGAYNSQQVIFKWSEAQTMNGGLFCLLTTFRTSDQYNVRYSFYANKDAGYDALFDTGITAIGVYIPADTSLAPFQAVSRIINSKVVNGGSWYQRTGMSLATLMPYVQFMYAGQIPYDCAIQTPYIAVNDTQLLEARQCRRQKKLLQEFYRAKNGTTAPYPDNGFYMYNTPYTANTTYTNFINITNGNTSIRDLTLSAVYNKPLGYTDVSTGRPLQAPATN